MLFPGIVDPEVRANVIAYLSTLSSGATPGASTAGSLEIAAHDYGGLPEGPERALVYARCSTCHSIHLVRQQGLSRSRWAETLQWMVDEQGMDEPSPEDETQLLDYLTRHFGENRSARQQ